MAKAKVKLLCLLLLVCLGLSFLFVSKALALSEVGTSTTPYALDYACQKATFYDATNGYHYLFYSNATGTIGYESSSDGVTWAGAFIVLVGPFYASGLREFSVWWNGSYVSIAYSSSSVLYYCEGPTNSSGLITWAAVRTAVDAVADTWYYVPFVFRDSSGYPVIGFRQDCSAPVTYYVYAVQATAIDGSAWSAATKLSATSDHNWMVTGVPLTNRDGYIIYGRAGQPILGAFWNNTASSWTKDQAVSASSMYATGMSAVSTGADVYLVFDNATTYETILVNRTANAWNAEVVLDINDGVGINCATPVIIKSASNLCVFILNYTSSCVYGKNYTSGVWGASWLVSNASAYGTIRGFTASYEATSLKVSLAWVSGAGSPYTVIYYGFDAPNSVPTIGAPSGTNWDDTDNCYAQKKTYTVSVTYTDTNGFADIHYCELYLKTGGNTTRAEFQFHEDDNSWSTVAGSAAWTLTGYSNSSSGNNIAVVWGFQAQWDATEESDLDFLFFVTDTAGLSANSVSDQNFDAVSRLVTTGFTNDDDRINIAGTTTISGTVYYGNGPGSNTASTSYPPNAEFTQVDIHDSGHVARGTDNTIVNGAFSASFAIPNAVQSNTYHAFCNLADADGTDQDFVDGDTTAVVGDRVYDVVGLASTDTRIDVGGTATVTVTLHFDFDETDVTTGGVTINGVAATHLGVGQWRIQPTSAIVAGTTYNTVASTGNAYGITSMSISSSVLQVWDRIEVYEKDDPIVSGSKPLSLFDENGLVSSSWFGLWNAMPVFLLCLGFGLTKIPKRKTKVRSLVETLFAIGIVCLVCFSLQSVPAVKADTTTFELTVSANDGYVSNDGTVYLTVRNAASGTAVDTTSAYVDFGQYKSGSYYYMRRSFLRFNTSSIPDDATITSAKLCLYGYTDHSDTDFVVNIQKWTEAPTITTADYNGFDGINYDDGGFSTASYSATYNNITFSNFTVIDKAGFADLCLRSSRDVSATAPTGNEYLRVYTSEGGAGKRPLLEVTWIVTEAVAPTYSNIAHNTTIASNLCLFSCYWTDNVGLSGFIFETNNTGSWTNDTWSDPWDGTPLTGWANVTKTLNATVGQIVGYQWHCNDTSNNWNSTGIQSLTTTYSAVPQYSNVASNTTLGNQPCQFSSYWTDDQALSGYIFGTNNTGAWNNESWSDMVGATAAWANITKTLNITCSYRIEFEWWCNDSQNQWNDTGIQFLTTTNPTAPTYLSTGYSTANASALCNFTCYWTDNVELSGFIFSTNNTGSWTNETWAALSGAASWANVTKTLNDTIHLTIGYRWFCNDTGNNWGDTGILTLYLLSSKPASVVVGTYVVIWFRARYDYDDVAYTSASGSTLSINGTLATYDSGAGYWWINVTQTVAGNYTYLVSAVSDGVYGLTVLVNTAGSVIEEWTRTNVLPANNACDALDLDAGDVLAWRKYYWFNVTSTDEDGFIDMTYTDLGFEHPSDTYTNIVVRYTEASSSFSITVGSNYIAISGCTNSSSDNVTQLAFYVAFDWDYPLTYDIDARVITMDDYGTNDTDIYDLNMGYINTVTTTPATSDPRANVGGSVDISGTVIYTGTAIALPDSQVNTDGLIVHNSTHASQGTGSSGIYSIPITLPTSVGDNTYHIYVDGSDADFTDEDKGGSVSVASDRIRVNGITLFFEEADGRVNVGTVGVFSCTAQSEYDGHVLEAGDSLVLGGYIFAYNGTFWVNSSSPATPISVTINSLTSVSEVTFGITAGNINANSATGAWDRIRIDTLGVDDGRVNVNTQGTFYVSATLETDAHSLGAGDSLTLSGCVFAWNGTYFVNSTTQVAVTSVTVDAFTSGSETNYGITAGNINGKTNTVIWDRIRIDTLACVDPRIDVSTQGLFYCTASLEAGGHTLTNGDSLTLSGHVFSWNITSSRFEYYETNASVIDTTIDSFSSGNEVTYGITVGNINLMTATEVWDRFKVNAASLVFEDPDGRVNAVTVGCYSCTAQSEYDGHVLGGGGDSLSIDGYGFVYNGTYWVCDVIEPVPVAVTLNGLLVVSEATYGITAGNLNGNSAVGIWDDLRVINIQPVLYLGSGEYKYEAQLEYGYDLALINGGYVDLEYPNGTLVGKTSSNATGWVTFIVGQSNATSGVFNLYGENETTYSITRSGANQTFTIYLWTLTPQDVSGNSLTNTNHNVTLGATAVWNGTATGIYVPPDTFNLTVSWLQDLPVNSTVNVAIGGDTTTDLNCTCYPYVIGVTRYWTASNATIASSVYVSYLLTVKFSLCANNSYVLVASYTTLPAYILNVTYNQTITFAPGYLVMPHFGNTTIVVSYENWGGLYVQMTDHTMWSAGWAGQRLDIVLNGTIGDSGELDVNCASKGMPVSDSGFTLTSYVGGVFTGLYAFTDTSATVSLEWTLAPPSSGGTPGEPKAASLFITLAFNFPEKVQSGATVDGFLNISWMGATKIYIWSAVVEANYASDWEIQISRLPWTLETLMQNGLARVPVVLYITGSLAAGKYSVPCDVTFKTVEGVSKTVRSILTFEVTTPVAEVPSMLVYVFLGGLGIVVTGSLFMVTKRRRKYS